MRSFEELLDESVASHGHLCPGQIIGVRMAMLGCRLLGIQDPHARDERKKFIVFVEIDRCATDAIQSVTGCRLGKRTLKLRDYGIMAATFLHLETGMAFRIVSREDARDRAWEFAPGESDRSRQQLVAYRRMSEDDLFTVQRVRVELDPWEMPGPPRRHARCTRCGQIVRDGREIHSDGQTICRPCAGEGYFQAVTSDHSSLDVFPKEARA